MNFSGKAIEIIFREQVTSIYELISNIHGQIGAVMLIVIGITIGLLAVKVINGNVK